MYTEWSRENNTGRKCVARHADTLPAPAHPFYSFRRSEKQTDARAQTITLTLVIITAPAAAPPNWSFVSFKSRHRPSFDLFGINCQKRRSAETSRGWRRGRTMETYALYYTAGTSSMFCFH